MGDNCQRLRHWHATDTYRGSWSDDQLRSDPKSITSFETAAATDDFFHRKINLYNWKITKQMMNRGKAAVLAIINVILYEQGEALRLDLCFKLNVR